MVARSLDQVHVSKSSHGLMPFHPLILLYVFVAVSFVVYIPVSILRSNAPLLILDALLGLAFVQTLALKRPSGVGVLGGSRLVLVFLVLYAYSVFVGLINDSGSLLSKVEGSRSFLFGMGFLVLSSVWINSARRMDGFLRVYLLGALFAAIYGLRQLLFGLAPFELDRLSMFGASVNEIERLGRVRIPSSFGEPATFAFAMMSAFAMLPIARIRPILPKLLQRVRPLRYTVLSLGLLMSLVRGPLVGLLAAGAAFLFVLRPAPLSSKIRLGLILAVVGLGFLFALNQIVLSGALAESDNRIVRTLDNLLTSIWTTIPLPVDTDSLTWQQRNLRSLSVDTRQNAWREGLAFVLANPFGTGVGGGSSAAGLTFSITDVGFLSYGIELGWLGFLGFMGLYLSIPFVAYRKLRQITDANIAAVGRYLLALWVAYSVALIGARYLHVEVLSAPVWIVAGILLNLDVIARNRAGEKQ